MTDAVATETANREAPVAGKSERYVDWPNVLWISLMHLGLLAAPFTFSWTGLLLGVVSLYLMQDIVARVLGTAAGWVFVVVVAALGSVGIYLGRFLRWNSWDLVRRPGPLAGELFGKVTDPASQPRLLGFTLVFALLFLFIYVAVYIFAKLTKPASGRG